MNRTLRITTLLLLLAGCFMTPRVFAQKTGIVVTGTVVEKNSDQPIEFATVVLKNKKTQQPITGGTTSENGTFELQANAPDFWVEITFVGFETLKLETFTVNDNTVALGKITLSENSHMLGDVVIQGDKSTTEFRLDKRVFNVGKDLSSTGASALEVLNQVPSVNVSIEGRVMLRGASGVQILINGKPSVIASEEGKGLGSITADMIERIEVITNPSAKYQAEGTAGILNIVLKKEERTGLNGSISVNTGVPDNHSVGLSMNRRSERWNLFTQLGAGYRQLPEESNNINRNLTNGNVLYSEGLEYRNEYFYNFILGADYYINKNNVITLSGNVALEMEDQPSRTDFRLEDAAGTTLSEWYRTEVTDAVNPKYQYELQYKRDFTDHKEHDLIFSAIGSFFGKDQSSTFENTYLSGSSALANQRTNTKFQESRHTFQLDYTKPIRKKYHLETGVHYVLNDVGNDFSTDELIQEQWLENAQLTNDFKFTQNVLGAYGTGSFEDKKWGAKLGLRLENTDLNTLLVNTNQRNDRNFTNFFPTLHTSYKITDRVSVQAGYSRRIFRPRLWDLNPFFNIRNNFSIRTGNPNLMPEFTDSYELMAVNIFEKATLNYGLFYRYTTEVIEQVSTFQDQVSITQPYNIGTRRATGFEVNGKYTPGKKLSFNGDLNINYFTRNGDLEGVSFDFTGHQWASKLTAKLALPAQFDFEITGQYLSKVKTVQGTTSANLFADLGLRKKIMKGRGIFSLSVRDVFRSRFRETETNQPDFYLYNWSRRGRFVALGFSYGFGKGEAMEYSGQRRRG